MDRGGSQISYHCSSSTTGKYAQAMVAAVVPVRSAFAFRMQSTVWYGRNEPQKQVKPFRSSIAHRYIHAVLALITYCMSGVPEMGTERGY